MPSAHRPLAVLACFAAFTLVALAGDIETQALELGKKLASIQKFTEPQAKPFLDSADAIRMEVFNHYGKFKFSDDNRMIFCQAVLKTDPDPMVRIGAVKWLAELLKFNKSAAKPLADFVTDKMPVVRAAACEALVGYRGDPSLGPKFAKLAADDSNDVRQAAVRALGKLGDRKQVPVILEAYKKVKKDSEEDAVYGEALALLGEESVSLNIARTCLKQKGSSQATRISSITALECNQDSKKVIPIIMENLINELRRTTLLDSTKKDWDYVYVTMCSELQKRTGKTFGNDAIQWYNWWDGVRESYKAPAPAFDEAIVTRWMDSYRKMGPSKVKE